MIVKFVNAASVVSIVNLNIKILFVRSDSFVNLIRLYIHLLKTRIASKNMSGYQSCLYMY
jgi:hypothetical protein